jgi:Domain of unknown function (DUF5658)
MIYAMYVIFILLQIGDIWTTYNIIKSDKGHEANPIMAWIMKELGNLEGLIVAKSILILVVGAICYGQTVGLYMLSVFNIVYAYVVYLNYKILKG